MTDPIGANANADDEKRQEVTKPWKSFMWLGVHDRDFKS
jgi:hypothetical protein